MRGRINTKGGSKINGIKKEFPVVTGGSVNTGDFVKLIDKYLDKESIYPTTLLSQTCSNVKVAQITNNKVFIVYIVDSNLYGMICTLNNDNVNVESTPTLIASNVYSKTLDLTLYKDNTYIVSYGASISSKYYPFSTLCTLDDNLINVGTPVQLSSAVSNYSPEGINSVIVADTLITYWIGRNNNKESYLISSIISSNSITVQNKTTISTNASTGSLLIPLVNNKILLLYGENGTGSYSGVAKAILYELSEDKIITSISTLAISSYQANQFVAIKLSENRLLIVYRGYSGSGYNYFDTLFRLVLDVSSMTIVNSSMTSIGNDHIHNIMLINYNSSTKLLYSYESNSNNNSYNIYKYTLSVEENDVIVQKDDSIASLNSTISDKALTHIIINNCLWIFHNCYTSLYLRGSVLGTFYDGVTKLESKTDSIFGIAQSKGNSGDMVKVYVPN